MPRHEFVYDKELKATPEWNPLYDKWGSIRKRPHSEDFELFQDFYNWSMANGFVIGARLKLLDAGKPYSPDKCRWMRPGTEQNEYSALQKQQIANWNRAVNRLRVHYGLEPFPEKGES